MLAPTARIGELTYYQVVTLTKGESLSSLSHQNGSFTMCGRLVKGVQSAFPVPTESEKLSFTVKKSGNELGPLEGRKSNVLKELHLRCYRYLNLIRYFPIIEADIKVSNMCTFIF